MGDDTVTENPDIVASLAQYVREHAHARPDADAVLTAEAAVTYGSLDAEATRLAERLRGLGVRPGQTVAVLLPRSAEAVAAIVAVTAVGAAYAPLDPAYPDKSLRLMLESANCTAVVTDSAHRDLPPAGTALVTADFPSGPAARSGPVHDPVPPAPVHPRDLAYVVFTSGSTGVPKGVGVEYRAVQSLVDWHIETYSITAKDRCSWLAGPGFDASVWEIWPTLQAGATLCLPPEPSRLDPERLRDWLTQREVAVAFAPTPLAARLIRLPWPERTPLRALLTGGDRLAAGPPSPLPFGFFNHYGVAECAVVTTAGPVPVGRPGIAPEIGRPLPHSDVLLLDADGRAAAPGAVGELWVGGPSVARGYLGRPAATADRFRPDPAGGGGRIYRTGDLASWTPAGGLVFAGREDDQVKVNGHRVELGELEAALLTHPAVTTAAVVALDGDGVRRPAAWYVPRDRRIAESELWSHLAERLPRDVLPDRFIAVAELPLTAHGKVDRAALAASISRSDEACGSGSDAIDGEDGNDERVDTATAAPADAAQLSRAIRDVFADVLGREECAEDGHFFLLGGDSFSAVEAAAALSRRTGRPVTPRMIFDAPQVENLSAALAPDLAVPRPLEPIAAPVRRRPMSSTELGIWLQCREAGEAAVYNLGFAYRIGGPLDRAALEQAIRGCATRHEALRTTYHDDPEPAAEIRPDSALALRVLDASATEQDARAATEALVRTPYDLTAGPLARFVLVPHGPDEATLLVGLHHIIADGHSVGLLLREIADGYNAAAAGAEIPAQEPAPLTDVIAEEHAWYGGSEGIDELEFWRSRLAGANTQAQFPSLGGSVTAQRGVAGACHEFAVPEPVAAALRACAAEAQASVFMAFFAGFTALLRRYGSAPDLTIGTPHHNRNTASRSCVGALATMLGIRTQLPAQATFRDTLAATRIALLDAYEHPRVAYTQVIQALRRDAAGAAPGPLRVICAQLGAADLVGLDGLEVRQSRMLDRVTCEYDLIVSLRDHGGRLTGLIEYGSDVMTPKGAARLAEDLIAVLGAVCADSGLVVSRIELPGDLSVAQDVEHPAPARAAQSATGVDELIRLHARTRPDAIAIAADDEELTYAQLDERATRLAAALQKRGVRSGDLVALYLRRSPSLLVAMLAVMYAGGAYVPLDPANPAARLRQILRDCRPRVVLVEPGLPQDPISDASAALSVESLSVESLSAEPAASFVSADRHPDDLAYVLHTSGSTGSPQGVMVRHRSLLNYVSWFVDRFGIDGNDRFLASTSPGFDAFGIEVYPPLAAGGRVVIAAQSEQLDPAALARSAAAHGVTVLASVPTALRMLAESGLLAEATTVRRIMCGGEQLDGALVHRLQQQLPVPVDNLYGPTEATIDVTSHSCPPDPLRSSGPVPIGRALHGARLHVLSADGAPVPFGVAGELFIGGVPLAVGYLGRPGRTAERFVPDPFGEPGTRLYATGDLVRADDDGALSFLGRRDEQIKLHGHRIEPGEIAAVLRAVPGVRDAAVVLAGTGHELVAFLAADADPGLVERAMSAARGGLPRAMVPDRCEVIAALPRTANGKLDTAALIAPSPAQPAAEGAADRAKVMLDAYRGVLRDDDFGLDDSFFEFGGDSISALRVVARLQAQGLTAKAADVLRYESVRALLYHIVAADQSVADRTRSDPREEQHSGAEIPLTPVQRWFFDQPLADHGLSQQYCVLSLPKHVDAVRLAGLLSTLVSRHEALRLGFHVGPDGAVRSYLSEATDVAVREVAVPPERESADGAPDEDFLTSLLPAVRLDEPPLVRARLLHGTGEPRLVLACHHLAVDGVSWRILVDELAAGLADEPVSPTPGEGFAAYAARLAAAARSGVFADELAHWSAVSDAVTARPGQDADEAKPGRCSRRRFTFPLKRAATTLALRDTLLGLLAGAIRQAAPAGPVAIEMEGHGRGGPVPAGPETVGWFTALYPIAIDPIAIDPIAADPPAGADATRLAEIVAHELARVPGEGTGYGVLRHLGDAKLPALRTEAGFNFLGRFTRSDETGGAVRAIGAPVRSTDAGVLGAGRLVDVDAFFTDRELTVELSVRDRDDKAARIARRYLEDLEHAFGAAHRAADMEAAQ